LVIGREFAARGGRFGLCYCGALLGQERHRSATVITGELKHHARDTVLLIRGKSAHRFERLFEEFRHERRILFFSSR
jgi:hypothetical protein